GTDWKLSVAAVGEDGELDAVGAAVVEQRLDGGAHGATGVEDVVDQHHGHVVERELNVRGVDDRLALGTAPRDVVAVEGDVQVAEWNRRVDQALDQLAHARRNDRSAPVDSHHGDALTARLLDDLVRDPHEGAANVLAVEYDLLAAQSNCPSW